MLNNVSLQGRITRDLELKISNGGTEILKFNVAVQRSFKNKEGVYDADFINCIAFGKTAGLINQYSEKGKLITLSGNIQTGSYIKDDGTKVFTTDVIVKECDVFTGNQKNEYNINDNSPSNFVPNSTNTSPYDINNSQMSQEIEDNLPF